MEWKRVLRPIVDEALRQVRRAGRPASRPRRSPRAPAGRRDAGRGPQSRGAAYPGDWTGRLDPVYDPKPDGRPDPGEVVWTWVPYEEDHRQGKDRPVLLVGRDGRWLLALQLTSQDHDRDEAQEARAGRRWVDIGSGAWDSRGRPSEVRVNRVIRVDPDAVRREGAVLSADRFGEVAAAVRSATG